MLSSAFKQILDLATKCAGADWTELNKFFQTLPNLSTLAFTNYSKNEQNVIQKALKWLFFFNCKNCPAAGDFPLCPHSGNLFSCTHYQQVLKLLLQGF